MQICLNLECPEVMVLIYWLYFFETSCKKNGVYIHIYTCMEVYCVVALMQAVGEVAGKSHAPEWPPAEADGVW